MTVSNKEVARHLEKIAIFLELKGENPFKIQAFRKAATIVVQLENPLTDYEDLTKIPGIGKGTAAIIQEYLNTGTSETLQNLQQEVPKGLIPLLQIPGLGGKTIARLYKELGIENVEELEEACRKGKVRNLKGFGVKKEEKILEAILELGSRNRRLPLAAVLPIAERIEKQLMEMRGVVQFSRAGSLRRLKETVKDLDFIVATDNRELVKEGILNLNNIEKVTNQGDTKISCIFSFDFEVSVDFRIVEPEEFATCLHHFTGSKEHNVRMRQLAKERKEKISEYGVENLETGLVTTFSSEEAFFAHFGLPYIAPELREDGSELERILEEDKLVEYDHIQSDLHMHSTWSDGRATIVEMIEAARNIGYKYIAITDHSQNLKIARGLTKDRLLEQIEEIRRLNEKYPDITILAGIEMDILPDGKLDFEDEVLKELDFVIASIHSGFNQGMAQIMERLYYAMSNPYVHMIAHPTGRKIGYREGYSVDIEKLIHFAKETGTILELNANPNRFDLKWEYLIEAQKAGVPIAINTDSHHPDELANMRLGVQYGRKAWLKKENVVNTWTLDQLKHWLNRKKEKL